MSRLLTTLENFPVELRGAGLAIGNFDAVHRGHAALAARLVELAGAKARPSVVFTFDPPPGVLLFPERPRAKPLTTMARRAELFGKLGVDGLVAYPTSHAFLSLSAREFFDQVIVQCLNASVLVEGPNFHFGRDRSGNMRLLSQWCQQAGIQIEELPLLQAESAVVSSTRVRELVTAGKLRAANGLLIEPYRISGKVVSGARRGRTIGFPTANLADVDCLLPALGVYAGRVLELPWPAAIHIGPNPTFAEDIPKVEVHLPDWNGSLYDRTLTVEILAEVRGIQKFASVDELKLQLTSDVQQCQRIAAEPPTQ
jgi:riboflavin kinase/FMN adenylyltransferase